MAKSAARIALPRGQSWPSTALSLKGGKTRTGLKSPLRDSCMFLSRPGAGQFICRVYHLVVPRPKTWRIRHMFCLALGLRLCMSLSKTCDIREIQTCGHEGASFCPPCLLTNSVSLGGWVRLYRPFKNSCMSLIAFQSTKTKTTQATSGLGHRKHKFHRSSKRALLWQQIYCAWNAYLFTATSRSTS